LVRSGVEFQPLLGLLLRRRQNTATDFPGAAKVLNTILRPIMGMIISAINRAINEMDIKAIKELKIS